MAGNRKLGRVTAHRLAMLNGMATNLLANGKIQTTYTRAKEVSAVTDSLITLGKKGTLSAYRTALGMMTSENVAKKLFDTIAPAYAEQKGGYTQIFKLGPRRGDGAEMALIQLVEVKAEEVPAPVEAPKKKPATRKKKVAEPAPAETPAEEAPVVEAPAEEAPAAE